MYYACKELTIGRGEKVAAGQPIPSADSWSHAVLRAHLNIGWIEKRDDEPTAVVEPAAAEAAKPEPEKKAAKKKTPGSRK